MPQYPLRVWHGEDYAVDLSSPDAQDRVARVATFNDQLLPDRNTPDQPPLLSCVSAEPRRSSFALAMLVPEAEQGWPPRSPPARASPRKRCWSGRGQASFCSPVLVSR